jgi:PAS domain S-box-containing protein
MEFDAEQLKISNEELMERLFREGTIAGVERTWKKPDGASVVVEMNIALLKDDKGQMTGSVSSIRDITERKKTEEALSESEKKYRGVIDNIGIGVALISPNMEILALNNQMQQWFPEVDASKKPICYKNFNYPPNEKVCSYCPTFKTLKDGQVHESITDTPQGDKIINYRIVSSPLKDKEGNITSAIEMVENITEQMAAQEKLRESEEKYHNLIEHANDAIVSVDSAGRIIGFNKKAEEIFGYSRDEVIGNSSYAFIPHQNKEFYEDSLKHFAETGTELDRSGYILEGKAVKRGGVELAVEYSYFTINIAGEFIATAIIRDISKRKEEERKILNYQQQLKSLTSELILSEQKERQHFADFLHDEVGQQLFATRLQLEQLKNSLSSDENTKVLDKALNNLYQVMNQTRSLTTELSSPILKQLGLEKALEWLAEETHKKYDILVTFEDDKEEKPLDDNTKILLFQSVSELLTNVAKHARTNNASLSINRNTSKVEIRVKDSGVGFLVPDRDSTDIKIEGLGLFRIKERLELLGGQMEIESKPNHGTRITLSVPLRESV